MDGNFIKEYVPKYFKDVKTIDQMNFKLFCQFVKGHEHSGGALAECAGALQDRLNICNIWIQEIDNQIPVVQAHISKLKQGQNSYLPLLKLVANVEAYFNAIYSSFELFSKMVRIFYSNKTTMPLGFRDQKSWFFRNGERIDKEYSDYLANNTAWFDEFIEIRTEQMHYTTGLLTYERKEDVITPSYHLNVSSLHNKQYLTERMFKQDIDYTIRLMKNIDEYVHFFGNHFIQKLDQDKKVMLPYADENNMLKVKEKSLREIFIEIENNKNQNTISPKSSEDH